MAFEGTSPSVAAGAKAPVVVSVQVEAATDPLETKIRDLVTAASFLAPVTDEAQAETVAGHLKACAALIKSANESRLKLTRPLDQVKADIMDRFKGLLGTLERVDRSFRDALTPYQLEKRRQAEAEAEAARKAKAEADALARKEAEEAQRLADQKQAEADALAAKAKTKAQREAADRAADEAAAAKSEAVVAADIAEAVTAPVDIQAQSSVTRSAGGAAVGVTMRWTFEVQDAQAVPREFLAVNEQAIRAAVRDGVREIPGVRIFQDASLSVR